MTTIDLDKRLKEIDEMVQLLTNNKQLVEGLRAIESSIRTLSDRISVLEMLARNNHCRFTPHYSPLQPPFTITCNTMEKS